MLKHVNKRGYRGNQRIRMIPLPVFFKIDPLALKQLHSNEEPWRIWVKSSSSKHLQNTTHRVTSAYFFKCTIPKVQLCSVPRQYNDVIMGVLASQMTSLTIVYSTVYWDADQRKHQRSASLPFVWGIHRSPVNSPHKWLVTRKMFPFDDIIMEIRPESFPCDTCSLCRLQYHLSLHFFVKIYKHTFTLSVILLFTNNEIQELIHRVRSHVPLLLSMFI